MHISEYDFEYLRPPTEATFLNHNMEYIKSGSGKTAKRKIFYNTPFDTLELKAIQDLETVLQKQGINLPPQWNKSESLKYLYSAKFDMNASAKMIRSCLQWRSDSRSYTLTPQVRHIYDKGVIYLWGIDYHFRPILIINLNKLKTVKAEEESFDAALAIIMDVLRSYCFIPRKIENWVIIVDAQNVKNLDIAKIKPIIYSTKCIFPSSLEKLFVVSSPSLFESHWDAIQGAAGGDLPEEIHLLSNTDLFKLQTFIPPDSLEKKYGGVCPDVEKYWPPPERHVTQRGSNAALSEYSDPNDSGFLNESFRSEGKRLNDSKLGNNDLATQLQNQPQQLRVQPNERHTVAGAVGTRPNNLNTSLNNDYGRHSQRDPRSLQSVGDRATVPKEEEFIRQLIFSKSPSKSPVNNARPESHRSLRSEPGSHQQLQQGQPGSLNMFRPDSSERIVAQPMQQRPSHNTQESFQVKRSESGVPQIQAGQVDDDVLSMRSMASHSSRGRRELDNMYPQTLADQVHAVERRRMTEPTEAPYVERHRMTEPADVPYREEGSVQSFGSHRGSTYERPFIQPNIPQPDYYQPIVPPTTYHHPEAPKRSYNAPPKDQPSLNGVTRSPFRQEDSFRDTMPREEERRSSMSPNRKTVQLSVERGDTVHIEGGWRNTDLEERSTKKNPPFDPHRRDDFTPQDFRRKLIETPIESENSEDDERDKFCGLCIRRKPDRKKMLNNRANVKNYYN